MSCGTRAASCDEPPQYAQGEQVVGAHDGSGPRLKRKELFDSLLSALDAKRVDG